MSKNYRIAGDDYQIEEMFFYAGDIRMDEKSRREERRNRKAEDKPAKYRKASGKKSRRELAECWD